LGGEKKRPVHFSKQGSRAQETIRKTDIVSGHMFEDALRKLLKASVSRLSASGVGRLTALF
jgi:hypothetical protein